MATADTTKAIIPIIIKIRATNSRTMAEGHHKVETRALVNRIMAAAIQDINSRIKANSSNRHINNNPIKAVTISNRTTKVRISMGNMLTRDCARHVDPCKRA